MRFVLSILAAGILLFVAGCGRPTEHAQAYKYVLTAHGIRVCFPGWLTDTPEGATLTAEALVEIDAASPPVQAGWSVVVELPKWADPEWGLVRGITDIDRREIHVGWRFWPCEDRPLMPALTWEIANSYDPWQDPSFSGGH